jgi:hypothetical protein
MFKKIVSNLSFSPALVGQLGFYAKRLRKEQMTRRIGLVFVALALVVQCLTVFQPPESANASSSNDMVPGGLGLGSSRSINNFLRPYDANSNNLKDVMNWMGISRAEIANAQFGSWTTGTTYRSWGHNPIYTSAQGEQATTITNTDGTKKITTMYSRPMYLANGKNAKIYGWVGHSSRVGWFAIMQACGNLVTTGVPPAITPPAPKPTPPKPTPTPPKPTPPKPTPPKPTPPAPKPANIVVSKTAQNISQGNVAAGTVAAKENDKITFTLNVSNSGGTAKKVSLSDNLTDILEYSTLVDKGGGTFTDSNKTLSWPDVTLKAGEKQTRTFAVQVMSTIPATPVGQSDPESYNCVMNNAFSAGDSPSSGVTIPVTCAPPKVIEHVTTELPHTGARENMLFAGIVLAVVTYFFLRSKQLNKEVRLIRRDLNAGTI